MYFNTCNLFPDNQLLAAIIYETIFPNVFSLQCRVLLNLRTSQPFEEVLEDLGQVLKMNGAKRMYTVSGQEVRSFSQLRNEFADVDTFYLGSGPIGAVMMSPARRSRSRAPQTAIVEDISKQRRARSKSRPRALYAPESEIVRNSGKWYNK